MNDGEKITQFYQLNKSSKGIQALQILFKKCVKKEKKEKAWFLCRVAMPMI